MFLNVLGIATFVILSILTFVVYMICTISETNDRELKVARWWYAIWFLSFIFAIWRVYILCQTT